MALFDCGFDHPESIAIVARGLDRAGAAIGDVRRLILSHAHAEHCGGARRIIAAAQGPVAAFASGSERRPVQGQVGAVYEIRDGDQFQFRRFSATVLHMPGHTDGLVCLHVPNERLLFSSDHLLQEFLAPQAAHCGVEHVSDAGASSFLSSLARTARLDVRVVLPGRGAPFAGHRRVVSETIAKLRQAPGDPTLREEAAAGS
jgi:glyoxylase-like metal-dependent hydrolase (beta-lactamase superfamily II)